MIEVLYPTFSIMEMAAYANWLVADEKGREKNNPRFSQG